MDHSQSIIHFSALYIVKGRPITGLNRPTGFPKVKTPRFLDNQHKKVVGRQPYAPGAFTPGEIPGTRF
jgi:hypothetical protein